MSQIYCSKTTPASVCTRGSPVQNCLSTSQNKSVHNGFLFFSGTEFVVTVCTQLLGKQLHNTCPSIMRE